MSITGNRARSGALALGAACALVLTGCSQDAEPAPVDTAPTTKPGTRAVVLTSGGAAVTPFTTPTQACATGLAAGNTNTALREYLLDQGYQVYTSPAMIGDGQVQDQGGFGAFGDCPQTLPADLTVNSTGNIDTAGTSLLAFWNYLRDTEGITEIDVIGHSMGGLFIRSALAQLQQSDDPTGVTVRSLTTLGTPWQGTYLNDYALDDIPLADCEGEELCEQAMTEFRKAAQAEPDGAAAEVNLEWMTAWNQEQVGVLDDLSVTLIAGNYFDQPGNPQVWPNDGLVALSSALATSVGDDVLPHRVCETFNVTHSIFISDVVGLPEQTGMTWNSDVLATVGNALANADTALERTNAQGCPDAN